MNDTKSGAKKPGAPMSDEQNTSDNTANTADKADKKDFTKVYAEFDRMLGGAFGVMAASAQYAKKTLKELHERVLPPVALRQFRLVRDDDGRACGFISWAKVNAETMKKLQEGDGKITPAEWNNGDIGVVMDMVAPNNQSATLLVQRLKAELFTDSALHAMRADAKNKTVAWTEVPGEVNN